MSEDSTKRERDENHNSSYSSEEDEFREVKKVKLESASDEDTVHELTTPMIANPGDDPEGGQSSLTEPTILDERENDEIYIEQNLEIRSRENDASVFEEKKLFIEENIDELRNSTLLNSEESAPSSTEGLSFEKADNDLENVIEDSIQFPSQDKELTSTDPTELISYSNPNAIVEERGEISAQYVGKVIGKGGEMLRDLQARSGCRLDVDQNVPHGHPRILTYRGTRKKVDLAKQMVGIFVTNFTGYSSNSPIL
jgi:hypothetical protein